MQFHTKAVHNKRKQMTGHTHFIFWEEIAYINVNINVNHVIYPMPKGFWMLGRLDYVKSCSNYSRIYKMTLMKN